MSWTYRILFRPGAWEEFALHEVYYDEEGNPHMWTDDPVDFAGQSVDDVRMALVSALYDTYHLRPLRIENDRLVEMDVLQNGGDQ